MHSDNAAVQFMILDFLQETLRFTASPGEMGQFLARQLRELFGARAVVLLRHGADLRLEPPEILAIEPERLRSARLMEGLGRIVELHGEARAALLLAKASSDPRVRALMESLGLGSISLAPLRVGGLRVGTLLALDHLELQRMDDVTRLLDLLSPVFALILRDTAHFAAQEAKVLAQAEEYRALLQANLDGYLVVDETGRILEANQAYLDMSGYVPEEIRALRIQDLEALESPEEAAEHFREMRRLGSQRFTSAHRRKDGAVYPTETSAIFVHGRNVAVAFIRDLTERVAAEAALQASEAHHRELVEILGEGVALSDPADTFLEANPEADRIFGLPRHGLAGRSLMAFLDAPERKRVADYTGRRLEGRTDSYQVQIRRPDGSRRTLQVTATPRRDAQGQVTGSLAVFRDATDELKAQDAARLAQKMESLGNLAGGLAHDMNNVLGAILGLATTHVELQPEGSALRGALEVITKACLRGRNMVKGLLDFARKDVTGERPVPLNDLVRGEARLLERTIPGNIRLELELDPAAGTILGDPDALGLVLMNLCVNAMDAMPEGGSLRLATARLDGGQVLLSVADTGAGMPREVLERAVEPFFTTKSHGKGTGLGLSLAYNTVKAHKGQLEIRSSPGQGTTIELRFPYLGAESAHAAPEPAGAAGPAGARVILLVDDDELIQSAVAAQLEVMGHRTVLAERGEAAMALVDDGLRPDLVLLDMNMPGWGGERTLPKLRAALPGVPVVLSTGRADQRTLDLARAHPGVCILAKPCSFNELKALLGRLLER